MSQHPTFPLHRVAAFDTILFNLCNDYEQPPSPSNSRYGPRGTRYRSLRGVEGNSELRNTKS
jgi:hypothetical protein